MSLEHIAILDLGAPHVEECVQALAAVGLECQRADDFSHLSGLEVEVGVILVPSCARASWVVEQIRSHPRLSFTPVVGFGEQADFQTDGWLGWPVDPTTARLELLRWLAESRALRAQSQVTELLSMVSEAERLIGVPGRLEQSLEPVMRLLADLYGSQAAALLVLGKDDCEVFVAASTELAEGIVLPLDEPAARTLATRIAQGRSLLHEEQGGDSLLAAALERDTTEGLDRTLTLPVSIAGRPAGGLLVALHESLLHPPESLAVAGRLIASLLGTALQGSALLKRIREQTSRVSLQSLESELRSRSLKRYQEFFESSPDGIIVLDDEANVLHINQAGAVITGYAAGYLVGRPLAEIVAEHHREGLAEIVQSAIRGVPLRNFDLQLLTTSEDRIVVAVSTSSLKLDRTVTVFTFRDVTEARSLETELLKTKEFLERLIASAVDAIVAADAEDGVIILFNRGAENLFGRSAEETVGALRMAELFPEEEYEDLIRQLHGNHFGGPGRLEQTHKHALDVDGQHVPVSMTASVITDEDQEVAMVAIITDLREQIRMQERLAITQERLEVTEKQALIAELAGTTAHELNQPLTSVMGYAELLKKKLGEDSPYAHSMGVIMQEAERMAEIVRKIGKITRYETKSYVGTTQILDLERAAEE